MARPAVTKEAVEKLAAAVGIELSTAEIDQLTPQLDRLLSDLARIPDAELQDVEPPLFFEAGAPESGERAQS
jgi:Asp-tRNA(Asn)/Glu-tRNA(Gln) amidotransferase C subunit